MEDIEIEYLDEYKDLVLPGIKTSSEGRASNQALMRLPQRRRISSDSSGSSSIDPDIFQKLFDGKFLDDELLTESGTNEKGRFRRRLSSSSSDSNDALDALYNRQSSQFRNNRRDRLESYDSIDDLGDALMGQTHKSPSKAVDFAASKKSLSDGLHRSTGNAIGKSKSADYKLQANKYNLSDQLKPRSKADFFKPGNRPNGSSSSSTSSNTHLLPNKKKAITIIKAKKPTLKPPKHEPKEDPLHLQDFSDDSDSDSSYEYESDFYGYGDSDDDGEGSKQVIDISTDSSTATSLADTVTPVVSEDESLQQQQQQHMPCGDNERLQLYLNNLSSAESPPSKHKYTANAKKSRSHEKQSTTKAQTDNDQVNDSVDQAVAKAEQQLDGPSSSTGQGKSCNESEKTSRADYVDVNLTYETLERLSLSLAEQIINIDVERSKEFEKRSASKPRSTSIPKLVDPTIGLSSSKSHVRKLTYSSENLDKVAPKKTELRRAKSDSAFPKRRRRQQAKTRAATTEEQNNCVPLSLPTIANAEKIGQETKNRSEINKEDPKKPEKIKRKRGRPRKKQNISKTEVNDAVSKNLTEQPSVVPSENENKTVKVNEDINLNLTTDESAYKTPEKSKRAQPKEELHTLCAALKKLADADLKAPTDEAEANKTITYLDPEDAAFFELQDRLNDSIKSACGAFLSHSPAEIAELTREIKAKDNISRKQVVGKRLMDTEPEIYKSPRLISAGKCLGENSVSQSKAQGSAGQCMGEDGVNQERAFKNASAIVKMVANNSENADTEHMDINMRDTAVQERTDTPALEEMSSQKTLDFNVSRERGKDIEASDGNVDEQITREEPAKIDELSEQTLPGKSLETNSENVSEKDIGTEKSEESKNTLIAEIDTPEEVTTKVDLQQIDEEMGDDSGEKPLMTNPITNIPAEKNHLKANKSDNPENTMQTRRSALAKASPCPGNMSLVISTGRESRSSKRLLRGDNNAVLNTGTPHRNTPRLLEKSPAGSDASVPSKGNRKEKKDKSIGDLLATRTPQKSNVDNNIERKTRKSKHEIPKQEESLNDRPLRSSKPSETTENEKSEAIDKTHKKPKESPARAPQPNDIDNTPKERKSRRLKHRSKIEKSPSKQMETDVSHTESLHNPTALAPESIEQVNNEDSSTTAGVQSVSSASASEVNNTKETDTEISSTEDKVIKLSAGDQFATAVEAEAVLELELPTTTDLNDKFKSTCSEDQPIIPENPPVLLSKDEATSEGQKGTEEAVASDIVNSLDETAKGKLRAGLTREVRDLIQEAKEWEVESIESHGRSTRSRVATPVPLKGRRVRSREPKSAERPAKDQNKTAADTEPTSSDSTVKELPKKGQKEAIKKTKNDPSEIVNEPATPLKADTSAQSEFDKTSSDFQEINADEHIEKPAPRFAKQKRRAAKNINNQTDIVETEPAPANSVTPKIAPTNDSSTPFPSTPSSSSSGSSRRKLRILLRKVVPRSKINFSQKLENVQEGDEILNSSSDQQPEEIALEQISVDNPLDNRGDLVVNEDSVDQAMDNIADPCIAHAQTDMAGDEADTSQSGPGQNLTDLPTGQVEVNLEGDSLEPETDPTQTAVIQKIDEAADDTSTGSEVPISDQQTISTENAEKELCPEQESADHDVHREQTQSETANEEPQQEEKTADEDQPQNEMEIAKEQQQTENEAAENNEQQHNMENSHENPKPEKDASDDGQQHSEEQPKGDNDNDNSCQTETTGVTGNVDDAGDDEESCTDSVSSNRKLKNREMDASQPDAAKRKKTLQAKESHASKGASNITAMAPPAPPKRELSTGKAVLRRLGKPLQTDVQPTQKRRKLASSTVEHQAKASDKEPTSLHKAIEELRDEARKHMLDAKKLLAQEAMQGVVSGQTATKLSKKKEVNKTPPVKSSLSTLLSGDDSMSIDNSVIITKTAITSTTEPFKKVETPSTPVSGINISVSLVPDGNKLASSPPKKTLTQAETVRKMMLMNTPSKTVDATKEPASVSEKTLAPLDSGKKSKTRKADAGVSTTDKRASLPAKLSLPRKTGKTTAPIEAIKKPISKVETSEKLETEQATQPAEAVINTITPRKSFPQAKKLEAVLAAPAASPSVEDKDIGVSAATEKLSEAKPANKMELRKVANKSFGKSKSKESVTAVEQPPIPLATNPTSDSRDSSNERTKRSSRMTKLSLTNSKTSTPVTRACSQIRSTTATPTITPTQQRNASNERQQLTLPQLVGQLPPKPQRQSRKSLKLAAAEPQPPQPQPQPQPEIPDLAPVPPSRKRKLPAKPVTDVASVKRQKELPVIPDTSIAFPVRITAASTVTDKGSEKAVPVPETITKAPAPSIPSEKPMQKPKELQLPSQPLPQKTRKLRVRLNRNMIKNWVLGLQEIEPPPEPDQAQPIEPPTAIAPIPGTAAIPPTKEAEPAITRAQPVAQTQLLKAPVVRSMPLPVPLPVLEVKAEQVEVEEQQQILPPEQTVQMEVDVPVPTLSQVAANISCSVNTCAAAPTLISTAPTTHADINCSRSTAISSTTASSTTISSNATSSTIPSANSLNDQHTFGTTKMFSFLYPSRYQRSYGHVGLDFCCPNLDGPMQAIDPTRLHSKVEVPVLELPQYMVISTKIISKQDKNIPQKVRAKLEQLAAKDGLPCVIQTTATSTTAPIATSTATSATQVPTPPSTSNIDPLPKQQQPRNTNLTKKVHPPNAAAATPGTSVPSSQSVSSLVSGMLQLPSICPTDKLRVELQTRVQLFDVVLQSLARRAISMSVSERQQVIERIVRTSTLLPIDVDVGTKLLENYVYYVNAVTNTISAPMPQIRAVVKAVASTPSSTPASTSNSVLAKALNTSHASPAAGVNTPPVAAGSLRQAVSAPSYKPPATSRPIYDKDKNIIGYQYKTPKLTLGSTPVRAPAASSTPRGSTAKGSLTAASGIGTPVATVSQQQRSRIQMKPAGGNSKVAGASSATTPVEAEIVANRVGSGTINPFNPSPAQKTYARSTKSSANLSRNLATPVGVVNGVPVLGTKAASSPASAAPAIASKEVGSNRNLFIVNQVLSQPEECILPDTIRATDAAAEIKGEVEDAEILT
ncbi:platelet binding protein GspB isoform X2 [Drosophila virilis]|uniref:platelet binding protein GspB isoform X2 n=1 Tax=Drosophila virilis TaxID=7244 RepID=UPI001395F9C9|nr:protein piccolo isoform X2 [Drosophila virilis]